MPRRLLLPLLALLALLCAGAPAALAAPASPAPRATAAQDDAADLADDDAGFDDACSDEALLEDEAFDCDPDAGFEDDDALDLCGEDLADEDLAFEDVQLAAGEDDDAGVGEEELGEDGDIAEDELGDDELLDDEACFDEDEDAPVLSALRATVAGRGRAVRVRVGFRLDRDADVRLTLQRVGAPAGGRAAARCSGTAAARKAKGGAKGKGRARRGCARRTVALPGSVVVAGETGANSAAVGPRWRGRTLAPGGYRLTATPVDGGAGRTAAFTIAPRARKAAR